MRIGIGLPNPVLNVPGACWWPGPDGPRRRLLLLATIDRIAYPSYDSLTALTAAAAVTERIGLVTNILLGRPTARCCWPR